MKQTKLLSSSPIPTKNSKIGNAIWIFGSRVEKRKKPKIRNPKSDSYRFPLLKPTFIPAFRRTPKRRKNALLRSGNWRQNETDFLIVSAKALITKIGSPEEIKNLGTHLKLETDFPPEDLIEKLVAGGYVREEPIKNIGEFSVRGGILDVWSPTAENPVRIEFFGDTVDSMREFDAETQLSIGGLKEISIAPMREFAAVSKDFNDWSFFARERFSGRKICAKLERPTQILPTKAKIFPAGNFFFHSLNRETRAFLIF